MRFIYMLNAIQKAEKVAIETQRKTDHHNAKILELEERRILHEAKVAQANNAIVLQDIAIDLKKLELEALEKKLHPPRFNPDDESPPMP